MQNTFHLSRYINFFSYKTFIVGLICLLPVGLLAGSLISNFIVTLISVIFLKDIIVRKKTYIILKDKNFYFLLFINIYLVLNSIFISQNHEAIIKSLSFFRFIIFIYALAYYFNFYKKIIIKFWIGIFIIVTLDIYFEYFFGHNILGYTSLYHGRIASFTGDELKIGAYYFGFALFSFLYLIKKSDKVLFLLLFVFIITSLIIGERSNFIKVFLMFMIYIFFFHKISFLKKTLIFVFISLISFFLVTNDPLTKSRFYNQIFTKTMKEKIDNDQNIFDLIIKNNVHLSQYKVAILIFLDNPISGSGFKTFRHYSYKKEYNYLDWIAGSTHPHQLHFELLSELGLIGYSLIIINLWSILFRKQSNRDDPLPIIGKIFILTSLIPILPSGSFFTSYTATIFFINYSFLIKIKNA